jgi:hypothetical protein
MGHPDVCVIHERHAGLIQAIIELKYDSLVDNRVVVWPDIQSRWCMRHLGANFYRKFKNKDLMNFFKRLCNQNQETKFNIMW